MGTNEESLVLPPVLPVAHVPGWVGVWDHKSLADVSSVEELDDVLTVDTWWCLLESATELVVLVLGPWSVISSGVTLLVGLDLAVDNGDTKLIRVGNVLVATILSWETIAISKDAVDVNILSQSTELIEHLKALFRWVDVKLKAPVAAVLLLHLIVQSSAVE